MKKINYLSVMAVVCLLLANATSVFADGDTPIANRSVIGYIYDALGNIIGYIYG
jgi:hypothetical protein